MNDLEKKRKNIELGVKIGAFALFGLIISPIIFLIVKGMIGVVIAIAIGAIAMNYAPVVAMKLANDKIKKIKEEAAKNPIETLQNDYRFKMDNLNTFGETIKTFTAHVNDYESEVRDFSKQYPDRAPKYKEQLDKMRELLELRKRKYSEAKESLNAYDLKIQELTAEWNMSQAALKVAKAAGMSEDDFFSKIKSEAAFDSVQHSTNRAFADLEFALMEEDDRIKELPAPNQKTEIILDNVEVKDKVKA